MAKYYKNRVLSFLAVLSVVTFSGCGPLVVGAVAGIGGYAWVSGVLDKDFLVSSQTLQEATRKGLRDLKLTVLDEKSDRLTAKYKAEFAEGQKINIVIKALTERSAKIRIRVGFFGNRTKSEMVLNAIEKRL